jgi:predicted amidohydrolase YtcJ
MRAAVERRTEGGAAFEPDEALTPEEALALFATRADAPGGAPRQVTPGEPADLCLLDRPWAKARERLRADDVRAAWCRGRVGYREP